MEHLSIRKAFFLFACLPLSLNVGTTVTLFYLRPSMEGVALLTFAALAVTAAALLAAAAYFGSHFGRRAEKVVHALQLVARGDLSHKLKIPGKDEFSWLAYEYDCARKALLELIGHVTANAQEVAAAAAQLSVASDLIADRSQHQSEAASTMAAAVEEMTVSVGEVAQSADSARGLSERARSLSKDGNDVIHAVVTDMHNLADSVNRCSEMVQNLGQQSEHIRTIIHVINEIADQTNLLALNAAIEAARAGEQGRGFAVVADEVRKLAERTGNSTKEIATTIENVRKGTELAVASMNEGAGRVNAGVSLANKAGMSIKEINTSSQQVVVAVSDISSAMTEQSTASNELARNVEKIARMAEENTAAVQEANRTVKRLAELARALDGSVSRFRI